MMKIVKASKSTSIISVHMNRIGLVVLSLVEKVVEDGLRVWAWGHLISGHLIWGHSSAGHSSCGHSSWGHCCFSGLARSGSSLSKSRFWSSSSSSPSFCWLWLLFSLLSCGGFFPRGGGRWGGGHRGSFNSAEHGGHFFSDELGLASMMLTFSKDLYYFYKIFYFIF